MTDLEVFKRFLDLNGGGYAEATRNGITYLLWEDGETSSKSSMTHMGYEEVYIGAMFDTESGGLGKGFIDSHIAWCSDNNTILRKASEKEFPEYCDTDRNYNSFDYRKFYSDHKQDKEESNND